MNLERERGMRDTEKGDIDKERKRDTERERHTDRQRDLHIGKTDRKRKILTWQSNRNRVFFVTEGQDDLQTW